MIFKVGDILKVFFYDTPKNKKPHRTWYGLIVDDNTDQNNYIQGRYLHDQSSFFIINNEYKDRYGRIILEKVT